jgi:hypothetical protein
LSFIGRDTMKGYIQEGGADAYDRPDPRRHQKILKLAGGTAIEVLEGRGDYYAVKVFGRTEPAYVHRLEVDTAPDSDVFAKESAAGRHEQYGRLLAETDTPLIGNEGQIPWRTVEGEVFRITHFTPFASVEGDTVASPPVPMPYGLLTVESPILNQPALMPINHREEFRNFWEFQALIGDAEHELLVSYLPCRSFFARLLLIRLFGPRLHLRIRPKGELE